MTTYPDINWDEPIRTMDGKRADIVGERWVTCPHTKNPVLVKLVCVESPLGEADPYGDVHQISKTGHRVDYRTPCDEHKPLIRNLWKCEKWIVLKGHGDGKPLRDRSFAHPSLFESESRAIASLDEGEVVAHVKWQE